MNTIEEIVDNYKKKLNEIYARANTKSKRKRIARDLIAFKQMCTEIFEIDKKFAWEDDTQILSLFKNYRVQFVQNIVNNSVSYNSMFTNVINEFIKDDFQVYKYYEIGYQRLTIKEMQELIFDFLGNYDYRILKDFKEKLDNAELFYADLNGYNGITYSIGCLNKNLIFYTPAYGYNINSTATIIHETGHSFEMNTYYSVGRINYFDMVRSTPYYEISSRFLEYAFLNYLKENNICVQDVNKRLHTFLFDLLVRSYEIMLIYKMNEINIDELDNIYITDDSLKEETKEIQEKINYYSLQSEKGDIIKYKNSFLYGLGNLTAIHLYENYKEDPNYFKKKIKKCSSYIS